MSAPGAGPSAESCRKSMSQNLGTFASQCTVPPPTSWGSSFTAPVYWAGTVAFGRQVRGNTSGSGPAKLRVPILRSSLENVVPIGPSPSMLEKRLGPFSKTTTSHPARASSMAAIDPPAPLPITTALPMARPRPWSHRAEELQHVGHDAGVGHRIAAVGALNLTGRVAERLDVPGKSDIGPAGQSAVAAILGVRVQALDCVLEQQRRELAHVLAGEDLVLFPGRCRGEVPAR